MRGQSERPRTVSAALSWRCRLSSLHWSLLKVPSCNVGLNKSNEGYAGERREREVQFISTHINGVRENVVSAISDEGRCCDVWRGMSAQ